MAHRLPVCGRPHPTRQGVLCWGRGCELADQHWSYIKAAHDTLQKVTWRLDREVK